MGPSRAAWVRITASHASTMGTYPVWLSASCSLTTRRKTQPFTCTGTQQRVRLITVGRFGGILSW